MKDYILIRIRVPRSDYEHLTDKEIKENVSQSYDISVRDVSVKR